MTHAELVLAAARWLRRRRRCRPVFAELVSAASEIPDAIGWTGWDCHVVECKTSCNDLRRDAKKPHHIAALAAGSYRWILAPTGVLEATDIPPGHGWIETTGKRIVVRSEAPRRTTPFRGMHAETLIMRSAVLRHELGVAYDPKTFRFAPMRRANGRPD